MFDGVSFFLVYSSSKKISIRGGNRERRLFIMGFVVGVVRKFVGVEDSRICFFGRN